MSQTRLKQTRLDSDRPAEPETDHGPPGVSLRDVHAKRGLLVRLAYRFCWNVHDAEDAVQDALASVERNRNQLADESKLWSWVKSIVVRECLTARRKAASQKRTIEAIQLQSRSESPPPAPGQSTEQSEFKDLLKKLIAQLPDRQRTAIVLRHLEEMAYPQIAETMGVSESTARVQVRNAREALREAIVKNHPEWAMEGSGSGL